MATSPAPHQLRASAADELLFSALGMVRAQRKHKQLPDVPMDVRKWLYSTATHGQLGQSCDPTGAHVPVLVVHTPQPVMEWLQAGNKWFVDDLELAAECIARNPRLALVVQQRVV